MKKSLIFALALMLVLAFATSAMALQAPITPTTNGVDFKPTSGVLYEVYKNETAVTRAKAEPKILASKVFKADGVSNYPYEIYLPNEINPGQYRIHSNYSKNTDACASCHSTHTAMNDMLLQWYTAYDTCMACHDGTVSTTYDVARGIVGTVDGKNVPAAGGMFGFTGKEVSLSSHNVTGALENTAAPGGTTVASADGKSWNLEFSCTACHAPHGEGGNARLLKGDVNGQATLEATRRAFNTALTATDPLNVAKGLSATVYGEAAIGSTLNGITGATSVAGLAYYYVAPTSDADRLVYNVGAGYMLTSVKVWVYNGTKWEDKSSSYKIDNQNGYTRAILLSGTAPALANVKFVGVPIVKVVMDVKNYLNKDNNGNSVAERVYHNSGINQFCGACHTDYNTASFEVYNANYNELLATGEGDGGRLSSAPQYETGAYSKAHRHSVGRKGSLLPGIVEGIEFPAGNYSTTSTTGTVLGCLGCHVAHGTAQDYWNMTLVAAGVKGASGDVWTSAETVELSGSSALKRQPNMGICLNCHNKQTSAIGYASNSNGGVVTSGQGATGGIIYTFSQNSASFVGMQNSVANCAACHLSVVEEFLDTQHAVKFGTWDPTKYYKIFDPKTGIGNITEEGMAAVEKFTETMNSPAGDAWFNAVKTAVEAVYTNANVQKQDVFNVGQLPIGTRAGMGATREFVLRYWDEKADSAITTVVGAGYRYAVAGAAIYNPVLKEWEIEAAPTFGIEGNDNYTNGCFNCHAALTKTDGTVSATGSELNRAILDGWYAYLNNGGIKPGTDIGITCEACHGQASNHVKGPNNDNIYNPATDGDSIAGTRVCGRCHVSSGNLGGLYGSYDVWKLSDITPITAGVIADRVVAGRTFAYATNAQKIDALFQANYQWQTADYATHDYASASASEWTYKDKEGKVWGAGSHSQFPTYSVNRHFKDNLLSCGTCHDSHSAANGEFQLKAVDAEALCAACHSVGGSRMAYKYMPKQNGKTIRMHDFGNLVDNKTKLFKNTNIQKQPTFDAQP